ncbi:MAG: YqaA family protein [Neptuniibacter sp.]
MTESGSLFTLFISGIVSATLLPGGSEALLAWQLSTGEYNPWSLWFAVTTGNALGGILTCVMGWVIATYYPLKALNKPGQLRAKQWLERFGPITLLMSWLPIIGDPLCLVAGWLKFNLYLSFLMICLGKAVRYLLIVGIF